MADIIAIAKDYVRNLLSEEATGHDYLHSLRVLKMAINLASDKDVDIRVISLAALLHDLDDYKIAEKDSSRAYAFLSEYTDKDTLEKVMEIIENMSYSSYKTGSKVSTLEGMIVQDADRLDALGAIGIARTFAYSGKKNRPIYSEDKNEETAISHFYDKLLKLEGLMNLEEAKKIAKERTIFLKEYLEHFKKEI